MLEPLLSEEDDDSTAASGTSDSSASTEFEPYKPTLMQRFKQTVGELCVSLDRRHVSAHTLITYNMRYSYCIFLILSTLFFLSLCTPVNVCLIGGVGASAAAMVLAPALMMFVAGGICIANVPYAMYKERELKKIPTLRAMNNKLRADANKLEANVDQLSEEIDILEPEADRAAAVEGNLRKIANKQHVNVDKLVDLVKENEQVLVEMRVCALVCFQLYNVLQHLTHNFHSMV